MNRRCELRAVVAAIAVSAWLALGCGQAFASHLSCGDVVTTDVTLDSDITGCGFDESGLIVGADGVTIDLNGHTISASDVFADSGIEDRGGYDGIRIENGTIRGFESPILLSHSSGSTISSITVSDSTFGLFLAGSDGNTLTGITATNNFQGVLLFDGSDLNSIRDVSASGNFYGILMNFGNHANVVDGASLSGNAVGIRLLDTGETTISNSSMVHNGTGADIPGSVNTVVSQDRFVDNGYGIFSGGSNNLTLTKNVVTGSKFDGVFASGAAVLEKNRSDGNGGNGFKLLSPATTVTKNTADDNGLLGIDAAAGTIDGGGNKASGNGNALQCANVFCK